MKKPKRNSYIVNEFRITIIIAISITIITSLFITGNFSYSALANEIEWDVTLFLNETNGIFDYVVFGEATDANDGPPHDEYDTPKPPAPIPPYLRAWFYDDLSMPYDVLYKDYREYPDSNKIWNLSVRWSPEDYSTSTNVTISWNINEVSDSEYVEITLYDILNNIEISMMDNSNYEFTCPAITKQYFNIICEGSNTPPETPNEPIGETDGYHGTSYNYITSTTDADDDNIFYQFDWNDSTFSEWLGPYSSGETCSISKTWESPGIYNITVKAKDIYGYVSQSSSPLLIVMMNRPPNIPNNPYPLNQSTDIDTNIILRWDGGDPDGDFVNYDVYFGTKNPPPKIVSKQSSNSFDPLLGTKTTYYWKIVAWDNFGEFSNGLIWRFTTKESSNGGNGQTNGEIPNIVPIADASASESIGIINSPVIFDGSRSFDQDGYITNWTWDFGDKTQGNGEKLTHVYKLSGSYNISLTVKDNQNATDTDSILVYISIANNPPTNPNVSGVTIGKKNVNYSFSAVSTDPDGDNLRYTFNWGDGNINKTNFFPSNIPVNLTHRWNSAGIYKINVTASDNQTRSDESNLTILIDSKMIQNIGYLIDINGDEIFDIFQNLKFRVNSTVGLKNNQYLIDSNNDGAWDYFYNYESDIISDYSKETTIEVPWTIMFVILIASAAIVLIVYFYKKNYF